MPSVVGPTEQRHDLALLDRRQHGEGEAKLALLAVRAALAAHLLHSSSMSERAYSENTCEKASMERHTPRRTVLILNEAAGSGSASFIGHVYCIVGSNEIMAPEASQMGPPSSEKERDRDDEDAQDTHREVSVRWGRMPFRANPEDQTSWQRANVIRSDAVCMTSRTSPMARSYSLRRMRRYDSFNFLWLH